MKLFTAHRILIGAAMPFFLFFAVFEVRQYARTSAVASLIEAVVSIVVAVGLVFYYRTLSRWGKP